MSTVTNVKATPSGIRKKRLARSPLANLLYSSEAIVQADTSRSST